MADDDDQQQQDDELALLEAMKKSESEFQWERSEGRIEGVMKIQFELPRREVTVKLDPESGIYRKSRPALSGVVTVKYLPPIKLHFQLQHNYPSEAPPSFSLSCGWLNFSQLSALCRSLDELWETNKGAVILYQWQQFLALEALTVLGIDDTLTIKYQSPIPFQTDWDNRGIQEMTSLFEVIPLLVEYDSQQKTLEFQSSRFSCEICFQIVSGTECICLPVCSHVYCKQCVQAHISNKIIEGNVTSIECPNSECSELISPGLIQELVSPELFERYDKLLLQRTLDGMKDIVYCPRPPCRCVTVKEHDSNMALCPSCRFSFCVLCKRTWHGISPCKVLPSDIKELKECYETGDEALRKSLEQQYGRQYLLRAFQEYDSSKWIKSNAKRCPKCEANIEKDHGCNKMSCSNCNCQFCWLCNTMLPRHNPYSHFHYGNSSCAGKLFEGEILDAVVDFEV